MTDNNAETFNENRNRLTALAYRMLGSASEADDVLQEAYLRWHQADQQKIESPPAWLTTIVTRLCIDHLRSAKRKREVYVGPWLPEPILTDEQSPEAAAILADDISIAFLIILERLGPEERAIFLLRDVFGYSFREIAGTLDKSEVACRQSASRARKRVRQERPRHAPDRQEHLAMITAFQDALQNEDLNGLIALLTADAALRTDGGGKARAAFNQIEGADKIARFFVGIQKKAAADYVFDVREVNGAPGIVAYANERPAIIASLDITDGKIAAINLINNPDKLQHLSKRGAG